MDRVQRSLRKIPLLSGLSDAELVELAHRAELRGYEPGTTIVAQNEPGDSLYLVLSGRVRHPPRLARPWDRVHAE